MLNDSVNWRHNPGAAWIQTAVGQRLLIFVLCLKLKATKKTEPTAGTTGQHEEAEWLIVAVIANFFEEQLRRVLIDLGVRRSVATVVASCRMGRELHFIHVAHNVVAAQRRDRSEAEVRVRLQAPG